MGDEFEKGARQGQIAIARKSRKIDNASCDTADGGERLENSWIFRKSFQIFSAKVVSGIIGK